MALPSYAIPDSNNSPHHPSSPGGALRQPDLLRVSAAEPCPICARPDWCGFSADGYLAVCMREETGAAHPARDGGGWVHYLQAGPHAASRPVAETVGWPAPVPLAPITKLDPTYRWLLSHLGLSDAHRAHLIERRGLPAAALEELLARGLAPASWSVPADELDGRHQLTFTQASVPKLRGIPGFFMHGGHPVSLTLPAGLLVPLPDRLGRIQGLVFRADAPPPADPKRRYLLFSTGRKPGGSSCGSPVAVWRPEPAARDGQAVITEGSLKALVTSYLWPGGGCALGVQGVAAWKPALTVLAELRAAAGGGAGFQVALAYDADASTNAAVASAEASLAAALQREGYAVQRAAWSQHTPGGAYTPAKGIDDALVDGRPVLVRPYARARAWAPPARVPPKAVPFSAAATTRARA